MPNDDVVYTAAPDDRAEDRFSDWQPRYAEQRIALFPVKIVGRDKRPAITNYHKVGLPGSAQLAQKFGSATTFGFMAGARNRVTVIDMDSTEESIVAEGERLFGVSPMLWRTGGGKFAMPFRHHGERRRVRVFGDNGPPIDLLGGGFVVAPPSIGTARRYEFIRGSLADFDRLPVARIPDEIGRDEPPARIPAGRRNNELFRYCNSIVCECDTLDQLLDAARRWAADQFAVLLPPAEIVKTCSSVWQFRGGRRQIMHLTITAAQFAKLAPDPEVLGVFAYLAGENGPRSEFLIADGLGPALGWPRRLVPAARKALVSLGIVKRVRAAGNGLPALYCWARPDIPKSVGNPYSPSSLSPLEVKKGKKGLHDPLRVEGRCCNAEADY